MKMARMAIIILKKIQRPPTPYKAIFTSVPFYAILVAHFTKSYGDYTLLTELPTYMTEVLHFPLKEVILSITP